MPHSPFVHLRVQSAYSMLEGAMQPKAIAERCRALKMPAVALVDRNNMFGAMEFADYCKGQGVQPIAGALLAVLRPGQAGKPVHDGLPLLAQDEEGYANLIHLVSRAHLEPEAHEGAHLTFAQMEGRTAGLIAMTGAAEGAMARLLAEGQDAKARDYLDRLQALFPDRLYVELSRCGESIEEKAEKPLIALAHERGLPLVATNPVAFADESVHEAHDILLCIANSAYVETVDRPRSCKNAYMRSGEAMAELFADVPEAVANTLTIARRCWVTAPARKPILPSVAGKPEQEGEELAVWAREGLAARLTGRSEDECAPYRERLEFEVKVISDMGFPGYFLIVADFIKWAKAQGIPVGPGRGSGAGSVVAWALTITDLDPLKLGLLFERFLNPERVSMPDFDIDFCETRREEVIRYVQQRYGRDQVAQIITFGKLKARAVLKDVGRVLQMPYGQVDRLAKLIPNHPTDPWTLERAVNGVPELAAERKGEPAVRRLLDLAMKLEGLPRHSSTHAAGVVIGDRPLSELVPMYRDPRSDMPVTQFDMKYVEKAGLVKFDFLGLKTLSVLDRAVKLLAARGVVVDLAALEWDDPDVYALLTRADTVGVFQFESEGMRRALSQVRPTVFDDIIALGALYRPGPMDNIPMFAARKNGREAIEFPHPLLQPILKDTQGVIVYQEQVMQAAQVLAGYSLGQADLLRRAMGKKIKSEMDAQRADFVAGAGTVNGIAPERANSLFDLIDKFAGYGFNKSHAAAYAVIAYHTAWLKAHHPVEFFAASMAYDIALTDKLAIFVDDMKRSGVRCLPPCVNASGSDFTVEQCADGVLAVRYALGALKGVGEKAMAMLVEERERGGAFKSLSDFTSRIDPKLLNKRQIESLAAAGAFDGLAAAETFSRAQVHAFADTILATAASLADAREVGQNSLFGGESGMRTVSLGLLARGKSAEWTLAQGMNAEKEAFGFFFSGHPVDQYRHVLDAQGARNYATLCEAGGPIGGGRTSASMAGIVEEVKWRTPPSGKRYLLVTMSDSGGSFVASCFDDDVQIAVEAAAKTGAPSLLSAELLWRPGEDQPRVTIRGVTSLEQAARRHRQRLTLELASAEAVGDLLSLLKRVEGGRSEVRARVPTATGGMAEVSLGRGFAIDAEAQAAIRKVRGVSAATIAAVETTIH